MKNKKNAFTLIEIIVSVAILGILSVMLTKYMSNNYIITTNQNDLYDDIKESYSIIHNESLRDTNFTDGLSANSIQEITSIPHTININGLDIDYEFYSYIVNESSKNDMPIFTYNFPEPNTVIEVNGGNIIDTGYWSSTDDSFSNLNISGDYTIDYQHFFDSIDNEVYYHVNNSGRKKIYSYEDDINNEISNGNYVFTFTKNNNGSEINITDDSLANIELTEEGKNLVIDTQGNDILFFGSSWYMENSSIEVLGGGHLYVYAVGITNYDAPFNINITDLNKYDNSTLQDGDDIRPSEWGDITFITDITMSSIIRIYDNIIDDYGTYFAWFYLPNGGIDLYINMTGHKNQPILEGALVCNIEDFNIVDDNFEPNDDTQVYVEWTGDKTMLTGSLQ